MAAPTTVLPLLVKNPAAFIRRIPLLPRLYLAAFAARRRLRSSRFASHRDAYDFAERFRWAGLKIQPNQIRAEALALLDILDKDPPRAVLEIGTHNGGTLFLWTRAAAPDAILVGVDLFGGILGRWSPQAMIMRSFARERQRVDVRFRTDSHDPATRATVEKILGGRPLDFLFIDGDHSYESVTRDFELYAPLVRPGGLIAFHDVSTVVEPRTIDAARFWADFKREHETDEIVVTGDHQGCGIGVYRVPPAGA